MVKQRSCTFLFSDLRRHIRISGTYGVAIRQTSGVGRGCSFSIIIANLYVATVLYLRDKFLDIELGAFFDDRNIATDSIGEIGRVLETVNNYQ